MRAIVDTGPLVAFLNRRDAHHQWAVDVLGTFDAPLLTCEAVVSEACYLLRRAPGAARAIIELVEQRLIALEAPLADDPESVLKLLGKYADVPMSLADACLVRLSERHRRLTVVTVDRDFRRYRRNGREAIPLAMP